MFSPIAFNDIKDEAGLFHVSFENELMIWEREEDGMKVKVTLEPISELPKGPADLLKGHWLLRKVEKEDIDITNEYNPTGKRNLHLRWDRRFTDNLGPIGRVTGYWQINAHRPIISFLHDDNKYIEQRFRVEFSKNRLMLIGALEEIIGITMTYTRIDTFPK